MKDSADNVQPQAAIFPDTLAPVIRSTKDGGANMMMPFGGATGAEGAFGGS